ncbi:SpoIIE family protein phosphatase [Scatolibacter rhodanostii]|uniref:SpoIIE family protein phosphatase n=1 Tax=Scatolibacter rhodanostii TaxID=2014781 RepID=UPI000C074255|nr:SpoIIE family protein phosphatase [Scatolibacter rhodanostii]
MEEQRVSGVKERLKLLWQSAYTEKILIIVASFLSGIVSSRGLVFGKYSPFGVAVVAAVPREGLWASALGAFIGYLLPSPVYIPVRYIATLVAVLAIRWSLSELKAVSKHPAFAPVAAFLPLLLTGITMILIQGTLNYSAALYMAESFLGAGCAYFIQRTADMILYRRKENVFDNIDLASLMITVCIFILAFTQVDIAGISIGRILSVLMVLYCARVGGVAGGTISGVAAGAIQGLSLSGLSYLSGAYGLGGLVAGAFSPLGKIAGAVAFILAHGIASIQVGDSNIAFKGAVEVAAATILYMAIPKSRRISEFFTMRKDNLSGGALRGNIVMRLNHASEALTGIYASVEEISKKLEAVSAPDIQTVYNQSAEKICAGCGKSVICWRKYKEVTVANFASLTKILKEKGKIESSDFQKEFLDRCGRSGEMRDEINKNYARHLAREAAELRALQVREVVESHFRTTSGILGEMAEEFAKYEQFDEEASERISAILSDNGMVPIEVCCRVDRYDRMTVEAEVEKDRRKKINRAGFTKDISSACGRNFSPPCVSVIEDRCRIQMCERAKFDVVRGFSQYSARNSSFCGDCAAVFYDGAGHLIALISDGMGTGGRAAVDGAMTVAMAESLLKAGIGFDSMLKTVNAALIAKSGDETLATLDVTSIDLFTGMAEFRKAGAAGTVLVRGKKTEYIESSSMPAGIMPDIEFVRTNRELEAGDMIVMVSDGVIATGSEWLIDFVENCDEETELNMLAEQITVRAKKERSDGHDDDVSVLILVLK